MSNLSPIGFREFSEDDYRKFIQTVRLVAVTATATPIFAAFVGIVGLVHPGDCFTQVAVSVISPVSRDGTNCDKSHGKN
jgi:hypothetical protein